MHHLLMPNLRTLVLLGVFGVGGGDLRLQHLQVLQLGLSTGAGDVKLRLPQLEELRLRMQCPQKLTIEAPVLKYPAFNLDVSEPSQVDLGSTVGLEELMYRASSFETLCSLVARNCRALKKVCVDMPLGDGGVPLIHLSQVGETMVNFSKLHQCEALTVLSIGPGLWKCMEMGRGNAGIDGEVAVNEYPSPALLAADGAVFCQEGFAGVAETFGEGLTSEACSVHLERGRIDREMDRGPAGVCKSYCGVR